MVPAANMLAAIGTRTAISSSMEPKISAVSANGLIRLPSALRALRFALGRPGGSYRSLARRILRHFEAEHRLVQGDQAGQHEGRDHEGVHDPLGEAHDLGLGAG